MNCKDLQALLIDYQEDQLDAVTHGLVRDHLQTCAACRRVEAELEVISHQIAQSQPVLPDRGIEADFLRVLAQEKANLPPERASASPVKPLRRWILSGIAASIALIAASFWVGVQTQQRALKNELVALEQEYNQLNKLIALSLIEDPSASKRLQAVSYAKDIPDQDQEILEALIQKMQNDRYVNVRLAAANALAQFVDNAAVVEALIQSLQSERNSNMQIEIIQILVRAQERRAIPIMKLLLQKEETPRFIKEEINFGLEKMS